jgi:hypothetical protein
MRITAPTKKMKIDELTPLILISLVFLGPAANAWLQVWDKLRGKNSDLSNYITQQQLSAAESKIYESINDKVSALSEQLTAIHRSLGRIEGKIEQK